MKKTRDTLFERDTSFGTLIRDYELKIHVIFKQIMSFSVTVVSVLIISSREIKTISNLLKYFQIRTISNINTKRDNRIIINVINK